MFRTITIFCIAAALFMAGCKREEVPTYIGAAELYFDHALHYSNQANSTYVDTSLLTFSYSNAVQTDSIYLVKVDLMGKTASYDRTFEIRSVDTSTTAIEGRHYDKLAGTYTLPANAVTVNIPLHIYRTPDMQQQQFRLTLRIQPNADFDTTVTQSVLYPGVSIATHTVIMDDVISQPARWLTTYLGTFSRKKILLICEQMEITLASFTTMSVAQETYYGKAMQRYLNQMTIAGTPVNEDDGTPMTMGASSL